jgi:hypothetical protein
MTIAQDLVPQLEDTITGSTFTYQGYLEENGAPANDSYNFRFYLWSDQVKTNLLGIFPAADTLPVPVNDGIFTAELDFGGDTFNGQELWLEIEVNDVALSPIQRLNATPYALSLRPGAIISGTLPGPMLTLSNSGGDGIFVYDAGGAANHYVGAGSAAGFEVAGSAGSGLYIGYATNDGIHIKETGLEGVDVEYADRDGFEVDYAALDGLHVGTVGSDGMHVEDAGSAGLRVENAGTFGIRINYAVLDGLRVDDTGSDGISIGDVVESGLVINHAGGSGISICSTGLHSTCDFTEWPFDQENGITLGNIENMAIAIDHADRGLYVADAGQAGAQIYSQRYGLLAYGDEKGDGIGDGIIGGKSGDDAEWGIFTADQLYVGGGISTNSLALIARVGGDQPVSTGDVVSAIGVADPFPENIQSIPLVGLSNGEATAGIIGVVKARLVRIAVTLSPIEEVDGVETLYTLRSVEGPAQPGDYIAITVLGVAQVKVAAGVDIQPGQRLTASDLAGRVRPLYTRTVEGMLVTEGAPVIGIALAAPEPGSDTILVFVTLR